MHASLRKLQGNLVGRQIRDLDVGQLLDGAAVLAGAARLDQRQAGAREIGFGLLLQAALRRHGDDEGCAHRTPPARSSRSIQTEKPTAGIGVGLPSRDNMPS